MRNSIATVSVFSYHMVLCIFAFVLVSSPKQCNAQTRQDIEQRLVNLENAVFGSNECETVKCVTFLGSFSEVKVKACPRGATPKLKITGLFVFKERCVIAYPPINLLGVPQNFSITIFGKVAEETYSKPTVILLKRGKKFEIL